MEIIVKSPPLHSYFPFSNEKGTTSGNINKSRIFQIAKNTSSLSKEGFKKILEKHYDFLTSGGVGGSWRTILVDGLVIGIYSGAESKEGEQASFERTNINKFSFAGLVLPFANFCSCFSKGGDFQYADLSYSLFTDANLKKANFANANLQNVDFSRANLRNADFRNANLAGADFENCDLNGTDFRNSNIAQARFPGAILDEVKH